MNIQSSTRTHQIRIDQVQYSCQRGGSGIPLLLVHGFPFHSGMWQRQLTALTAHFDVIAPDLRGFGASTALPEIWSLEKYADDLFKLLEQLKVNEPILFCGLSMGGYIAFEFWRKYGARLKHLILCNTRPDADDFLVARGRRQMAARVLNQGIAPAKEAMIPKLLGQQAEPALVRDVESLFDEAPAISIATIQNAMACRVDYRNSLHEIHLPVTVIGGSHDIITPAREMKEFAKFIPDASYFEILDAGHLTPLEKPDSFNKILKRLAVG